MTKQADEKTIVGRFINALHSATALISYRGIEFWSIAKRYEIKAEKERQEVFISGFLNGYYARSNANSDALSETLLSDIVKIYERIYHENRQNKPCKIGSVGTDTNPPTAK